MPDLVDSPKKPNLEDQKAQETTAQESMDRVADDAAEQGEKTEQRYDENHDIFTK